MFRSFTVLPIKDERFFRSSFISKIKIISFMSKIKITSDLFGVFGKAVPRSTGSIYAPGFLDDQQTCM